MAYQYRDVYHNGKNFYSVRVPADPNNPICIFETFVDSKWKHINTVTLPIDGLFARLAVNADGLALMVCKRHEGNALILASSTGFVTEYGTTAGTQEMAVRTLPDGRFRVAVVRDRNQYEKFNISLPSGDITDKDLLDLPPERIGTSQGILDFKDDDSIIWTDKERVRVVNGIPVTLWMQREFIVGGQLGAGVGVVKNGIAYDSTEQTHVPPRLAVFGDSIMLAVSNETGPILDNKDLGIPAVSPPGNVIEKLNQAIALIEEAKELL